MFDPKMDTGVLHGLPELPFDPAADLSVDEACWIMDEMMATEVSAALRPVVNRALMTARMVSWVQPVSDGIH
jgi:hypothetical protein